MSYRNVSSLAAVIFFVLFVTLISLPEVVYWLFSLQENELGNFLAKRASVLFLGFSILCFLSRNSSNSEVQHVVSVTVGSAMGAMALLGIYELAFGSVGAGILVAVFIEIIVSVLFFQCWKENEAAQ